MINREYQASKNGSSLDYDLSGVGRTTVHFANEQDAGAS
jgi:hypothetical protein